MLDSIVQTLSPARRYGEPQLGLSPVEYVRTDWRTHSLLFPDFQLRCPIPDSDGYDDDSASAQLLTDKHVRVIISRAASDSPVVLFDSKYASTHRRCATTIASGSPVSAGANPKPPFPSSSSSFSPPPTTGRTSSRRATTVQEAILSRDPELELALNCMFGSTIATYKGVTEKMNVIPLDFNIEATRTSRLVRPEGGFGGSTARSKRGSMQAHGHHQMQPSTGPPFICCIPTSSSSSSGEPAPHANRRTVVLTRSFSTLFSDLPVTHETAGLAATDGRTARWSPRFSISIVVSLPVAAKRLSGHRQGSDAPTPTTPFEDGLSVGHLSPTASRFLQTPFSSDVDAATRNDVDPNVGLISQNWSAVSRILCWLQQISEPRLVSMMRCYGGTTILSKVPALILEDDSSFRQLISEATERLVRAVSIPRVLCGQNDWAACRQEISCFGKYLGGGKDCGPFLSRVLTAFLAQHKDWIPKYIPRRFRHIYTEHVKATRSSELLVRARTVILYEDPILARILILLLSQFLPSSPARLDNAARSRPLVGLADQAAGLNADGTCAQSTRPCEIVPGGRKAATLPCLKTGTAMPVARTPSMSTVEGTSDPQTPTAGIGFPPLKSMAKSGSVPGEASPGRTWHAGSYYKPWRGSNSGLASQNLIHALHRAGLNVQNSTTRPGGEPARGLSVSETPSGSDDRTTLSPPDETSRRIAYSGDLKRDWAFPGIPGKNAEQIRLGHHACKSEDERCIGRRSGATIPMDILRTAPTMPTHQNSPADHSPIEPIRMRAARDHAIEVDIPSFRHPRRSTGQWELIETATRTRHLPNRQLKKPSCRAALASDEGESEPERGPDTEAQPDGSNGCFSSPTRVIEDNVAGVLSAFHPDFALQACKLDCRLEQEIRVTMKMEKTPSHHLIELLLLGERQRPDEQPQERWVDVCSTVLVDMRNQSVKRLRLRRLIKLPSWLNDFSAKEQSKKRAVRKHSGSGKAADIQSFCVIDNQPTFPRMHASVLVGPEKTTTTAAAATATATTPAIATVAGLEDLVFALSRDAVVVREEIVTETIHESDSRLHEMLNLILGLGQRAGSLFRPAANPNVPVTGRMCSSGGMTTPNRPHTADRQRPGLVRRQSHPAAVSVAAAAATVAAARQSVDVGPSNQDCDAAVARLLAGLVRAGVSNKPEGRVETSRSTSGSAGSALSLWLRASPVAVMRGLLGRDGGFDADGLATAVWAWIGDVERAR